MGSVMGSVRDSVNQSGYGQHDANWLGFYAYFRDACGLSKETKNLCGLWEICENAGWWLPHEKMCWISERHNVLNRDDRGRLHCDSGPAVSYPDGWSIWAWHGVLVPQQIIEQPETITTKQIDVEANVEIRRVAIERYGLGRYLIDSGATEMCRDDWGTLYVKEQVGDEPIVMVKVVNSTREPDGSFKDYFLRVHPDLRPLLGNGPDGPIFGESQAVTARNAVASTFGLRGEEYYPLIES
jgi:hypothetical protein